MIPNVNPGDRIQASQINPVIDAVNALQQPLGPEAWELLQESFDGDNLPWYIDSNTMEVRRPICYVDGIQKAATPYDGPSCSGPFYVGYNDVSGTLSVFDESTKEDTEREQSGGQIKHWEFQHVYDLYPVSVDISGTISAGPPVRAAHFCLCPLFGGGGSGGDVLLDLSSLDWTQTSASAMVDGEVSTWSLPPSAQNYHYIDPQAEDLVDLQISSSDGYRFLARPEGGGTLKYVQLSGVLSGLSTMISAISAGGGGGGGCSCDLSVTDPAQLSGLGQDLVQIADWTKDGWQSHVAILAPDCMNDVINLQLRAESTPFYYKPIMHQSGQGYIRNNFFFYGREYKRLADFQVTHPGTYYLRIETGSTGNPTFQISGDESTTVPPVSTPTNTDQVTWFPLWVVPAAPAEKTTGIPFDCRPAWQTPFYCN